jgi:site-specific DNA recombinase
MYRRLPHFLLPYGDCWDAIQAQLARNAAEHNSGARTRQPSLLAGMLFDGDGNRMTPSHAVKKGTRYRYYVSAR